MDKWSEHKLDVEESHLFYREKGKGDPWVFLHGMPVSSHIWVPVIDEISCLGRCLAPDMIGMGQSGKPDIDYTIFDHIRYMHAWFDAMDLHNVTLVLHGWGSLVGLSYAKLHPERIRGIVLFESHIRANASWDMVALPVQQLHYLMKQKSLLEEKVLDDNFFINVFLQEAFLGELSDEDLAIYQAPFQTRESRKVLLQYAKELPLGLKKGCKIAQLIDANSQYLQSSKVPKCLLYALPGFITPISTVQWAQEHLPNLTCVDLHHGFHFAQASNAFAFANGLLAWSEILAYRESMAEAQ